MGGIGGMGMRDKLKGLEVDGFGNLSVECFLRE